MPKHTNNILARFVKILLDRATSLGLDQGELTKAAGLTPGCLEEPDARIPIDRDHDLWQAIVERIDDPSIGVRLGAQYRIRDAGLVGYSMLHSRNLGDAILRLIRYGRILSDTAFLSMTTVGNEVHVTVEEAPQLVGLRQPIEYDLASCVTCVREITEVSTIPGEVRSPYPEPESLRDYTAVFGPAVRFDQPKAAMIFEVRDMNRPVVAADDTLCSYLDQHAASVLSTLASDSFSERVRRAIWDELAAGRLTLGSVASALAVSTRTLQRRLSEEGHTFADLLERFRERMAVQLLRRRDLAIYEIAYLLGYSEPSTFFRVFRRWKKMSPREFREAMA